MVYETLTRLSGKPVFFRFLSCFDYWATWFAHCYVTSVSILSTFLCMNNVEVLSPQSDILNKVYKILLESLAMENPLCFPWDPKHLYSYNFRVSLINNAIFTIYSLLFQIYFHFLTFFLCQVRLSACQWTTWLQKSTCPTMKLPWSDQELGIGFPHPWWQDSITLCYL